MRVPSRFSRGVLSAGLTGARSRAGPDTWRRGATGRRAAQEREGPGQGLHEQGPGCAAGREVRRLSGPDAAAPAGAGRTGRGRRQGEGAAAAPGTRTYWSDARRSSTRSSIATRVLADALQTPHQRADGRLLHPRRSGAARASSSATGRRRSPSSIACSKSIEDDKKAIADLHEEARHAGVPPGWLR